MNSQSLEVPAAGEMDYGLKTGGYSGVMHPGEWKSGRGARLTHGTAKFKCWVGGTLSSYSPQG